MSRGGTWFLLVGIGGCVACADPGRHAASPDATGLQEDVAPWPGETDIGPPPARDLVPYARLWARATRPGQGLWPHEAWDSIFTVREPRSGTGYKPIVGENAIRVDLQPWLARSVALDFISWAWEGATPEGVEVALSQGCGSDAERVVHWSDPHAPLQLGEAPAGCVEVRFQVAGETTLTALSLWTRDANIAWPDDLGPAATGSPTHPRSGVIEGFYGQPWSWRERSRMVRAMAGMGLGSYLYAPKDDALHRHRWREPYPPDEMDRFETWNAEARGLGVTLFFGISPFIDFAFDDEADYQALSDKVFEFLARGFKGFALLADDIEFEVEIEVDKALGERHAALANRLLADLRADAPDVEMWFVPTVYSDERLDRWPGASGYLQALSGLDPAIEVMWTGPRTSCATMTAADMQRFRALVGREPLIWDNFWANDGGDLFLGRILLAPFSGRSPDLLGAVSGIAHNLSLQGALSRLSLGTFAAWLAESALDPRVAVDRAIRTEQTFAIGVGRDPAHDAATLGLLMAAYEGSAVDAYPRFEALERAVSDLRAMRFDGVPVGPAGTLLGLLARLHALASDLYHSGLDVDLVDDAWFPAEKARAEAAIGLWTLALLGERLSGRDGLEAALRAQEAREASTRQRFLFGPGSLSALLDEVLDVAPEDRGFRAPKRAASEPPPCRVGTPMAWVGWDGAERVEVAGLPGALVDAEGRVTWTPPHAGTYEVVAVALSQEGWDFRVMEWVCLGGAP